MIKILKDMKAVLSLFIACLPLFLWAQTEASPSLDNIFLEVSVQQDSAIYRLLENRKAGAGEEVTMQGYRVQVYSSNQQRVAKDEAFAIEKTLKNAEIEMPVYVQYNPPFWKVRIGNFRTTEEAQAAKTDILSKVPELKVTTFVVRDEIVVRK